MDARVLDRAPPETAAALIAAIGAVRPALEARAEGLDRDGGSLDVEIAVLHDLGTLAAPLPHALGGLGLGTEAATGLGLGTEAAGGLGPGTTAGAGEGVRACAALLRAVGRCGLPLGRLYEGHVNAVRLVMRHGTDAQRHAFAADVFAGALAGVWATDAATPLAIARRKHAGREDAGYGLTGGKGLCSGVGLVRRPIVTAARADGTRQMILLQDRNLDGRTEAESWTARGMRASATGSVRLDGVRIAPAQLLGVPDAYLAQPDFSGGAWRVLAVFSGGLSALVEAYRTALVARGRHADPHQVARAGRVFIACRTAWAWTLLAADAAEFPPDAAAAVATVNLARAAVDAAIAEAVRLIEQSLGLSAFLRPDACERLIRDLTTYARQPALDAALCDGAAHVLGAPAVGDDAGC